MSQVPNNRFLSAPAYHAPATGMRQVEPGAFIPPPAPLATLTITPKGLLIPHQSLRAALGLRAGQPINLLVPVYGSAIWHLDLRDIALARIKWYADSSPRVEGIKLPPGLLTAPLTLVLLGGPLSYPDVHPMIAYAPVT